VQWESLPREAGPDKSRSRQRSVTAALLELHYSPAADSLESGTASGDVILREFPARGGKDPAQIRRLSADRVQFSFYPNDSKLRDFLGEGHVQVLYREPTDPAQGSSAREFHTASQKMKALFNQADGTVQSITQWDNFQYSDGARTATSGRSEYDAVQGRLVLSESPRIIDSTGSTTGDGVEYSQNSKIMKIQGHVRSIIKIEGAKNDSPFLAPSSSSSPNIIMAERMEYWTEEARIRYMGGVQMLSDNSQLQADMLQIFAGGDRIEAQGRIRHLIPKMLDSTDAEGSIQARRGTNGEMPNNPDREMIRIFSDNLNYKKEMRSIDYGNGVRLESGSIRMTSDTLRATMDSQGKRIERATAAGKVLIEQTGRKAKGELADYYFDPGRFIVSGELAEISDPVRGKSAARRLTFFTADDRIMLESQ
jgi:lipopolysaccharide export system protein LptA